MPFGSAARTDSLPPTIDSSAAPRSRCSSRARRAASSSSRRRRFNGSPTPRRVLSGWSRCSERVHPATSVGPAEGAAQDIPVSVYRDFCEVCDAESRGPGPAGGPLRFTEVVDEIQRAAALASRREAPEVAAACRRLERLLVALRPQLLSDVVLGMPGTV